MFYDLSQPIHSGMPKYPGDEAVCVDKTHSLEVDGFSAHRCMMGLHSGTHVDAPMHMTQNTSFIGEYDLERFCGAAWVFDVREISSIGLDSIDCSRISKNSIILFYTGMELKYTTGEYYTNYPTLTVELAEKLVEEGVKLVGIDSPSPDYFPFCVHKVLLNGGVFIVENLRGLAPIAEKQNVMFFGFPLAISADSSPIRAVAVLED